MNLFDRLEGRADELASGFKKLVQILVLLQAIWRGAVLFGPWLVFQHLAMDVALGHWEIPFIANRAAGQDIFLVDILAQGQS